jgi:hypothetical protein
MRLTGHFLIARGRRRGAIVKRILWVSIFIGVLSTGCAQDPERRCMWHGDLVECVAVPLDSPARDAEAKQFAPPVAGKAHVYIMRSRVLGPLIKSVILVDGKMVGGLAPMTYLMLELAPGEHVIKARADRDYETRLAVAEGGSYFIEHDFPHFDFFRPVAGKLTVVEPGAGKKAVTKSKRTQEQRKR